eukprot:4236996-Prymnesium_polylepis.2
MVGGGLVPWAKRVCLTWGRCRVSGHETTHRDHPAPNPRPARGRVWVSLHPCQDTQDSRAKRTRRKPRGEAPNKCSTSPYCE